jgi:hypothetical protein
MNAFTLSQFMVLIYFVNLRIKGNEDKSRKDYDIYHLCCYYSCSPSMFLLMLNFLVNSLRCRGQTQPSMGSKYPSPTNPGEEIVKSVLSTMAKPVYLLDITFLTQLRKDGHPSTYTGKGNKYVDCSHWCLAGVPDTWNEILNAALLKM